MGLGDAKLLAIIGAALGWRAIGFVAPAWLMAGGLANLLAEMGFAYTTRVGEIIPLLPGLNRVKSSQSLCYSTRAGWRRVASGVWNKYLYGRLRGTDLVPIPLDQVGGGHKLIRFFEDDHVERVTHGQRAGQVLRRLCCALIFNSIPASRTGRPSGSCAGSGCPKVTANRRRSIASSPPPG